MRLFLWVCILLLAGAPVAQAQLAEPVTQSDVVALQQRLRDDGCYRGAVDGRPSPQFSVAIRSCPSQQPILRIETGMHTARIRQIGVDRACHIAATGSDDKTVRVWSLPDGHLLRTLRIPIGPGSGGLINAVAISPDGRWIAAGGYDAQLDTTKQNWIYIFDASIGAIVARTGPLGNSVLHLAFSPDGRLLVATGAPGAGIKVIDSRTWRVVAHDQTYKSESYGAAFGINGLLYTVAYDGILRRYSSHGRRTVRIRGDKFATSVAVDPTGKLVAVGFADLPRVDIYDAKTLRLLRHADTRGLGPGFLGAVAWSSDGSRLFAAGGVVADPASAVPKAALFTFDREGRRIGPPLPLSEHNILSLQPCASGLAVASGDPAFGLIDANGRVSLWKTGVTPDLRGKSGANFTIAPDATQIRFGLSFGGELPVLFDLNQATLTTAPEPVPGFLAPMVKGLPITGWFSGLRPTFAGKPFALDQNEVAWSLAIRPDQKAFVLGTAYHLRAYDAQGRPLWVKSVSAYVWGLNISADGRLIVAAYSDGTIRWHRWSDGKELLALFVNRKTRAWVAWTPKGYYMASPGGENLIGWHVNRGWTQVADFFPASRFRARFNRPDIVRLVMRTLDENAAISEANETAKRREDTQPLIAQLPPVVRILDPADGTNVTSGSVKVDYMFRSPSGLPVDRIVVNINGRPVKEIGLPVRPLSGDSEIKGAVTLSLTGRNANIGLIAWSGDLASVAAHVDVVWNGAPATTAAMRRLYALVVGVSNYAEPDMKLTFAAKDANDFARALADQQGIYYGAVRTRVLTDRAVTRASILEGLAWLKKMATSPNDVSVLFLAGHGLTDAKGTYWFFPSDANVNNMSVDGVSQEEMRRALRGLDGKVLWFLDTCHAGAAAKRAPVDINVLLNTVTSAENGGIVVFASSTGRQVSVERTDLGNGVFTKALVEAIEQGKAAYDGLVTTSSLDLFVERTVSQLTNKQQTPVMERPPQEPDFAIAGVRKQ